MIRMSAASAKLERQRRQASPFDPGIMDDCVRHAGKCRYRHYLDAAVTLQAVTSRRRQRLNKRDCLSGERLSIYRCVRCRGWFVGNDVARSRAEVPEEDTYEQF